MKTKLSLACWLRLFSVCVPALTIVVSSIQNISKNGLVFSNASAAVSSMRTDRSTYQIEELGCLRGDRKVCTNQELSQPVHYRQVLVVGAGFELKDRDLFASAFSKLVDQFYDVPENIYTRAKASQILYRAVFVGGGAFGSPESAFGAKIFAHPVRGKALTLDQDQVFQVAESVAIDRNIFGVIVLFNTLETVTANAAPPSFIQKKYGVAKLTRGDLDSHYVGPHELAHASLNFLDEYIEGGFETMSIKTIDILSPLVLMNGTWKGFTSAFQDLTKVYDYRISDILAANGNENVDVTRYPSRVIAEGSNVSELFEFSKTGGMFFGLGTFHHSGPNIMGGNVEDPDDGFGWDHSKPQRFVVGEAFDHPGRAGRANDRIRNAGPNQDWKLAFGKDSVLMLFDADKSHQFQPTLKYEIQVGWYERAWTTCEGNWIDYPCIESVWRVFEGSVAPRSRTLDLKASWAFGLASFVQKIACRVGLGQINSNGNHIDLCTLTVEEMTNALVPTLFFPVPYQEVAVPTSQWMTHYYWRFRTDNGTFKSGFTGWSKFFRSF